MKSTTVLMVAFSFVAGLGVGLSGPLAKAGEGLLKIIVSPTQAFPQADRITASTDWQRGNFQPADFRWPVQEQQTSDVVCLPKPDTAHKTFPAVQHL